MGLANVGDHAKQQVVSVVRRTSRISTGSSRSTRGHLVRFRRVSCPKAVATDSARPGTCDYRAPDIVTSICLYDCDRQSSRDATVCRYHSSDIVTGPAYRERRRMTEFQIGTKLCNSASMPKAGTDAAVNPVFSASLPT